ncbi:hypothetical protein GCM10010174_19400 [Kutzneria viridogrisea]|uniref:Uncharacterized protein n=1 Tax=Kutzneria viridogrisea TaxID=47990 RepID=A0ABR6B7W5_9PSEU|nr:hypothetical protein [Kutzneria viridogrisea]
MNSSSPEAERAHGECGQCRPEIVDCLACKAAGIKAQAEYNAAQLPALEKARTDYDKIRTDYRDARHSVALEVADLRHQSKLLVERIRCLIKQEHVVHCLDKAYGQVVEQLRECGCGKGCCAPRECEFDTCTDGVSDEELAARIVDYQGRADAAKACFAKLAKEPTDLVQRVSDLKAEVSGITADLSGDPAKVDLKELYARALVARRHVHEVWQGFEHTRDFVDCLCRALMCWGKGLAAIAVLTGEKEVRACHARARKERCEYLRTHTVKEVLAVYDKICSHHGCHSEQEQRREDNDED